MQPSRRKEPFRYRFNEPQTVVFQITSINGNAVNSKPAEAEFLNISKSGCRITTALNLAALNNSVVVNLQLPVEEQSLSVTGMLRWQEQVDGLHHYGVRFMLNDEIKEQINASLRTLAGNNRITAL